MKKLFTMLTVFALLACGTTPAFAATQTVTVDIPARDYSYTMVIPQDCTLEYGNTDLQSIGSGRITSDHWDDILADYESVSLMWARTPLTNEKEHTIPIYWEIGYTEEQMFNTGGIGFHEDSNFFVKLQVSDWSSAQPGTRYTTTITYTASLMEKMNVEP